jgi:hypothetical protein
MCYPCKYARRRCTTVHRATARRNIQPSASSTHPPFDGLIRSIYYSLCTACGGVFHKRGITLISFPNSYRYYKNDFTARYGTPSMHRRPAASLTTGLENTSDSTYSPSSHPSEFSLWRQTQPRIALDAHACPTSYHNI